MDIILIFGIILIGLLGFYLNGKHVLNPCVIACSVFMISALFSIYSKEKWGYELHAITVFVIISSLNIFMFGTCMGTYTANLHFRKNTQFSQIRIPPCSFIIFLTIILLGFAFFNYQTVYKIAKAVHPEVDSLGNILKYARIGILNYGYNNTRLDAYSTYFCRGISYVCLYIFIYDKVVHQNKLLKNCYLLLPSIPLIIKMILSTGRTQFIYFAVYILVVFGVLFFQKKGISRKTFFKMIGAGLLTLILFLTVFSILQVLREGSSKNIGDVIAYYTGMSIPSLDDFLVNGREETFLIGDHTLFPVYDLLRKLGIDLPKLYAPYDFVYFNGTKGNVYTAFRRYIEDYTLLGNYIILLILGFVASYSYNFIYKKRGQHLFLIIYAMFIYPVFEISIEERVFMNLISTGTVYNLIAIAIAYWIFFKQPFSMGKYTTLKFPKKEEL